MKRYIKLFIILVLTLYTENIYAQKLVGLILNRTKDIYYKWERNIQKDLDLVFYNEDFCDYYLFCKVDNSHILLPGKNTIYTIDRDSEASAAFKYASKYVYFRGIFPKELKMDTPYALPVKNGEKTGWVVHQREPMRTMNFRVLEDTIYATRGGVACKTLSPDDLLIYHADHTFAVYMYMSENFVQAGDIVQTGQPIGIAGSRGIPISFFFLDKNKLLSENFMGYPYSHFTPVFRTTEGDMKLKERTYYYAATDDQLIMQDMDKRERKKYMKQKSMK